MKNMGGNNCLYTGIVLVPMVSSERLLPYVRVGIKQNKKGGQGLNNTASPGCPQCRSFRPNPFSADRVWIDDGINRIKLVAVKIAVVELSEPKHFFFTVAGWGLGLQCSRNRLQHWLLVVHPVMCCQ